MDLHPDFEDLLRVLLSYAGRIIAERGATIPFGAFLGAGEPMFVVADFNRPREEMVALVRQGLRESAAGKKVAGLCYDPAHSPPDWPVSDRRAVRVEMEQLNGTAVRVEIRWSRGWFGGIKWRGRIVLPGTRQFLSA